MLIAGSLSLIVGALGCGGSNPSTTTATQASPQTYFAPTVVGAAAGAATYNFDDNAATFTQTMYTLTMQSGPQILEAGSFAVSQRGLRSMGISTTYVLNQQNVYVATNFNPPKTGSFALELAGQTGGLVQLVGQPVAPLVAANSCPNSSSAETYQFITIPAPLLPPGTAPLASTWDPTTETAYGSADVSSDGSTVNLQNIQQFTLPSVGGTGAPAQPPASSLSGACAQTYYGATIAVPAQPVITNPGVGGSGNNTVSPQATIGIGSSGLLVEDNGTGSSGFLAGSSPQLSYENALGAGTGAIGLPKPSAALDTGALVGAQYLGFVYGAGAYSNGGSSNWSSHLASFGFSTVPSTCAAVAASSTTAIYGGDFPNDNPSNSANDDLAIDLGAQDSKNNGLFPSATVCLGANYAGNTTGTTYSFSAVAIAGQLNGKNAIFVLGVDSTQPWAIYLLQSN
jgi:hypothetical protein